MSRFVERLAPAASALQPGELLPAGPALFPSPSRLRTVGVAFDRDASDALLGRIARQAEAAAREIGCEPETRPFRPHVTFARLRSPWPSDAADEAERHPGVAVSAVARGVVDPLSEPARSGGSRARAAPGMAGGRGGPRVNAFAALLVAVAYLLGSVSFAVLLVRSATARTSAPRVPETRERRTWRAHTEKHGDCGRRPRRRQGSGRGRARPPRHGRSPIHRRGRFRCILGHVFPSFLRVSRRQRRRDRIRGVTWSSRRSPRSSARGSSSRSRRRRGTSPSARSPRWSRCRRPPARCSTRADRSSRPRRRPPSSWC